jgi:hypothetical protein
MEHVVVTLLAFLNPPIDWVPMGVILYNRRFGSIGPRGSSSSSVAFFYESSLRAGPEWRESLYWHQGWFEASGYGRLGRQAAGHPWSALRVVKSYRKTAQRPRYCSKPKQQLCIQNGTRAYYLNYLQRGRMWRGKKRRQSD